jgi:hypothetical protein
MPGSPTTPDRSDARTSASDHLAFRPIDGVGIRDFSSFAAQWLACTLPCRRFADILTEVCARLGADVGCYSFIAVDLHHLLLAGLPAHRQKLVTQLSRSSATRSYRQLPGWILPPLVNRAVGAH